MMASDAGDDEQQDERAPRRRQQRDIIDTARTRGSGNRARDEDDEDEDEDDRDAGRKRPRQDGRDDDKPDRSGDGKAGGTPGKTKPDEADKQTVEAETRRKSRRPLVITIAVVVVLLLAVGGFAYWFLNRDKVDTDDAYTDGRIIAIAPRVAGQVVSLDVTDNQFVHRGDPLIHIDPRQFNIDRDQSKGSLDAALAQVDSQKLGVEIAEKNFPASLQLAQANLASAKANLLLMESNYNRQKSLPKQATTQQDVDSATSNYQQALAQVQQAQARVTQAEPVQQNIGQSQAQVGELTGQGEQAKAKLDQSELNIEWTIVRAPQDGWVTRRNVEAGNYVAAGQQIMSIVTTDLWVTANFKETQLDGMRAGQRVKIEVDAYPDLDLRGHVDSIQRGSGSKFSAFPAENATGNFVKIVQRVPVKIDIDSGLDPNLPMPLGVSVVPTVTLK
jgi:membrane fusion protein (multidrug efflux system)